MIKTYTITLFFLFLTVILSAQDSHDTNFSISGIVTDQNGYSVSGAKITASDINANRTTFSDSLGNYTLNNLSSGTYILEINKGDFLNHQQIVVKEKNIQHNLSVHNASNYELDKVVLQVESVKSKTEKEGFAVNVIETEEAAVRNIQTNELLNRTVGIKVRQNGGLGSAVDYNLNGLSGNSVSIFIDGIPLSTYGSSFDLNSLSPNMIDRIEVYKGVVPGELADDALGGAINVILKRDVRNHVNASVSYGSFNTTQANFNGLYNAENSGFYLRASGFYNYSDNDYEVYGNLVYDILPNGRQQHIKTKRHNDAFQSYGLVTEAGFNNVNWADNFSIGFNHSDLYNEIQHGLYMTVPYKGRFEEAEANIFNLSYQKTDILKGLDINFRGLYSNRSRVINDTIQWNYYWNGEISQDMDGNPIRRQNSTPTLGTVDREIFSFRGGLTYSLNKNHRFIFNHLLHNIDRKDQDEMRTVLENTFRGTRSLQKNISSLTYEMRLFNEKLKTSFFGKYYQQNIAKTDPIVANQNGERLRLNEYFEKHTDVTGYGVAGSYLLTPAIVLMASAEKAVRLPTETETFGDASENMVENPSLEPEISDNYNLGFILGPYSYKQHQLSLSANGFIRNTKDKIMRMAQSNLNDAIESAPNVNYGKTISKGFDAELNYIFNKNLNILINMSKFNTRANIKYDNNGNILASYKTQLPNEPFFTANTNIQYSIENIFQKKSLLNIFYNFSFTDSFYSIWNFNNLSGIDSFTVPKQYIQDAGLSYVFPKKDLIVSLDVKNIFDEQAFDNFAVLKPGRAFYLKLNYTINNF